MFLMPFVLAKVFEKGIFYAIFHIAIITSHINTLTTVKMKAGVAFFTQI